MLNLTDIYAVKILICYFLNQMSRPITPKQLTEIATGDGVVNYFFYSEAISSMLENDMMKLEYVEGIPYYFLLEKGKRCAEEFKTIIPKSFRDRIMSAGLQFFARLKNESTVAFTTEKMNVGYMLNCTCKDNDMVLMKLSMFAPDEEQAEYMKSKIMLNPSAFYGKIVDYLIENEEFIPDISE